MKPIQLIACVFTITLVVISSAGARSSYNALFTTQYKLEKDPIITKASCKYCHSSVFGGSTWNKFGTALKAQWEGTANRKIQEALYTVLKENKDSDNDGFTDVLEVVAKTLPGDAKSKPNTKVIELEEQLKTLGGVEIFKPVVTK